MDFMGIDWCLFYGNVTFATRAGRSGFYGSLPRRWSRAVLILRPYIISLADRILYSFQEISAKFYRFLSEKPAVFREVEESAWEVSRFRFFAEKNLAEFPFQVEILGLGLRGRDNAGGASG